MDLVNFVMNSAPVTRTKKRLTVYTEEKRAELVNRYKNGESIDAIAKSLGVRYQAIYQVVKEEIKLQEAKY